jgi:uncharacterized protein
MRQPIIPISGSDLKADEGVDPPLLTLNNAHASELSLLDRRALQTLVEKAYVAWRVGRDDALLIALDHRSDHDGENFRWFADRYPSFVYIDRVVVNALHRGEGIATALYEALFGLARAHGHAVAVCEVNLMPPNPGSVTFHEGLGFYAVGEAALSSSSKTVRYYARSLAPEDGDGARVG